MITGIILGFAGLALLGIPIAFAVGAAVAVGIAVGTPFGPAIMFQRMVTGIDNFILVSIPLFILTGNLMNAGGITTASSPSCAAASAT